MFSSYCGLSYGMPCGLGVPYSISSKALLGAKLCLKNSWCVLVRWQSERDAMQPLHKVQGASHRMYSTQGHRQILRILCLNANRSESFSSNSRRELMKGFGVTEMQDLCFIKFWVRLLNLPASFKCPPLSATHQTFLRHQINVPSGLQKIKAQKGFKAI